MALVSYLEQFPMDKLFLLTLHTIPLSLLFLGFLEFFFNDWIQTVHKYFSTSSIRYKSGLISDNFVIRDDENNQDSTKEQLIENPGKNNVDDGSLSREEVEMVMENLGLFYEPENENIEEGYDFSHVFEKKEASFDEVKEAFDVFDENRDGFIDALELQKVVKALGLKEEAGMENCMRMINVFDQNGDERIDFQEFFKLLDKSFT